MDLVGRQASDVGARKAAQEYGLVSRWEELLGRRVYWRVRRIEDWIAGPRHPGGPTTYAGPFFRRLKRRLAAAIRYKAEDLRDAIVKGIKRNLMTAHPPDGIQEWARIERVHWYRGRD